MTTPFSTFLTALLDRHHLTQAEVARRIEKTQSYLYLLCRGQRQPPHPTKMQQLARAVEATPEETAQLLGYALQRFGLHEAVICPACGHQIPLPLSTTSRRRSHSSRQHVLAGSSV